MVHEMVEAGIDVKVLLLGAITERKDEIENLWDCNAPKVSVVEDAWGVNIWSSRGLIQFDLKTKRQGNNGMRRKNQIKIRR